MHLFSGNSLFRILVDIIVTIGGSELHADFSKFMWEIIHFLIRT